MIQNRSYKKIILGEAQERHMVRIESVAVEREDLFRRKMIGFNMLREIYDNPTLAACGKYDFDILKLYHDGDRWIVEAEATVEREGLPNVTT